MTKRRDAVHLVFLASVRSWRTSSALTRLNHRFSYALSKKQKFLIFPAFYPQQPQGRASAVHMSATVVRTGVDEIHHGRTTVRKTRWTAKLCPAAASRNPVLSLLHFIFGASQFLPRFPRTYYPVISPRCDSIHHNIKHCKYQIAYSRHFKEKGFFIQPKHHQ